MYTEYSPCPLFAPYVDKYWEFKGYPEYGMQINILPDGCTDFIFTLGEVANPIDGSFLMQPFRSYFVGPMTKYSKLVTYSVTLHMFGIRFLPCGIFRFMDLPLHELSDQRISTSHLSTFFDDSFTERLYVQPNLQNRIYLVETELLKTLAHNPIVDQQIITAITTMNQLMGKRPIRSLMHDICLSQRHFERKFKRYTGFTPKEYSRIIRFRHAIELLKRATTPDLLTIATEAGYYDLSHFTKEIRTMSGNTPTSFLEISLPESTTLTYLKSQ